MDELDSTKRTELIQLLVKVLGDFKKHSERRGQMAFNCPTCAELKKASGLLAPEAEGDHKFNLEVHYVKGMYNCWSCGKTNNTHGTIFDLFKRFGTEQDLYIYKALNIQYEYVVDEDKVIERTDHPIIKPSYFIPLSGNEGLGLYKRAFNYLTARGITPEMIKKFGLGWCYEGRFEGRIVIPSVTENGDWDYFSTRAVEKHVKPKYLNCDEDQGSDGKDHIVFNEAMINWQKTIFVVEGPFDHLVTPNSLPMLGKRLYPLLLQTIYDNAESNVVVLTDPDAIDDGVAIYRELDGGKLMGRVYINFMPKYYDPAKYFEKFGWENYKKQLMLNKRLLD